jgi:hypothetical protein
MAAGKDTVKTKMTYLSNVQESQSWRGRVKMPNYRDWIERSSEAKSKRPEGGGSQTSTFH